MKMYIPEIGDRIVLTKSWDCHPNGRSTWLAIPKGTELKIDRVYIRTTAPDYSSITFRAEKPLGRFWASLKEVNTIEYKVVFADPNRTKHLQTEIQWDYDYSTKALHFAGRAEIGSIGKVKRFRLVYKEDRKVPYDYPQYKLVNDKWEQTGNETRYYTRSYFDLFDNDVLIGCYCEPAGCKAKARAILKKERA